MKNKLREVLKKIVSVPELHARWLETLSHLELQGAKKIIKSLPSSFPSRELLQHAYEETRHAYFFKKKVPTVCNKLKKNQEILLGKPICHRYVHLVDLIVAKYLKGKFNNLSEFKTSCYYLTSYIIEIRALDIYKEYNIFLKENNSPWSLDALIAEESQHLTIMNMWMLKSKTLKDKINSVTLAEHKIFSKFLFSLEKDISSILLNTKKTKKLRVNEQSDR
jgi:hypothetical protein